MPHAAAAALEQRRMLTGSHPREFEAAYSSDPLSPRLTIRKAWCTPAWPKQFDPNRFAFLTKPVEDQMTRRQYAAAWTAQLRVLLPDSSGAPSAARREHMWAALAVSWTDRKGRPLLDPSYCPSEQTLATSVVRFATRAGLTDKHTHLFLEAAVAASVEAAGLERCDFRLLLMRLHQ